MTVESDATDSPLVSVIIPASNTELLISRAIDSVFAQDYLPIEIVAVNAAVRMLPRAIASGRPTEAAPSAWRLGFPWPVPRQPRRYSN